MLEKLLTFVLGQKAFISVISKRLVAFVLTLLASVAPILAQVGFKINIDETALTEYFVSVITLAVTYIIAESQRPSKKTNK